ncbi:MAG TPA: enoyl-CoA hydratase/isomerase family protein [Novosphingobium sp.]|nr:enoyl-CoA hydratase/isomerase family protein [Novosphingobium sp.]
METRVHVVKTISMEIGELFLDAESLRTGFEPDRRPLILIDLSAADRTDKIELPACPVIGVGDPHHPLAMFLDAVIEPPAALPVIAKSILEQPAAARIAVQLLRLLPGLTAQDGLVMESLAYATLQGGASHRDWIAARRPAGPVAPGRVDVRHEAGRLTIALDRADAGNAIDRPMRDALHEAFCVAAIDPEVRHVSLRAKGKAFSLGADLDEFGTTTDPAVAHLIRMRTLPAHMAARCADKLDVHVDGACVGAGLELAAWATRFTAAPNAWFQLPELAMGILPGAGGCVSLTRRIGRQRTALMILSGRRFNARQALDWGLIDAIVDDPAGDDGQGNILAN